MSFLWYILIGILAGWVAGKIMRGGGFGLVVNLVVGIIGGLLGGWLFGLFGLIPVGSIGSFITSVIGEIGRAH
ncbi:GlsB/YeaQ/YmgE family stress response membrane protein, partial [Coprobacter fastidiosus]|uniref:GlsB/YeaQ/YmgE family stress response membrane protein n=1 Tax=Coprobacter fastidiosus TaxID=1099853 RepID=UPI00307FF705